MTCSAPNAALEHLAFNDVKKQTGEEEKKKETGRGNRLILWVKEEEDESVHPCLARVINSGSCNDLLKSSSVFMKQIFAALSF